MSHSVLRFFLNFCWASWKLFVYYTCFMRIRWGLHGNIKPMNLLFYTPEAKTICSWKIGRWRSCEFQLQKSFTLLKDKRHSFKVILVLVKIPPALILLLIFKHPFAKIRRIICISLSLRLLNFLDYLSAKLFCIFIYT